MVKGFLEVYWRGEEKMLFPFNICEIKNLGLESQTLIFIFMHNFVVLLFLSSKDKKISPQFFHKLWHETKTSHAKKIRHGCQLKLFSLKILKQAQWED